VGLRPVVHHLARRADASVFCVPGSNYRDNARLLRLAEGIHVTTTPRAASILLIVGQLDAGLIAPALVAHDALAPPRPTGWWGLRSEGPLVPENFPDAVVEEADPIAALRSVHEELVVGRRDGDAALLPDVEPASWRGIGPYGQGGKAMTGGVPYGRPMAERADDRDGLKLDYLPVRVGPLFAPFPIGLTLDVRLQGDVIQQATLENFATAAARRDSIFQQALRTRLPIRELELARARSHLHWLSDAVAVTGSSSLAERILRLARRVAPKDSDSIRALECSLHRRGFFSWSTRGVGVIQSGMLQGITGPVGRASGVPIDARLEDETYRRLGFEPVMQDAGDTAARWIQRIREAGQALALAQRAGDARVGGSPVVESPRGLLTDAGGPSRVTARLVPSLIGGMEWGEAVATVVSLDLDMSEAKRLDDASAGS
jgi:hypothetical protein